MKMRELLYSLAEYNGTATQQHVAVEGLREFAWRGVDYERCDKETKRLVGDLRKAILAYQSPLHDHQRFGKVISLEKQYFQIRQLGRDLCVKIANPEVGIYDSRLGC